MTERLHPDALDEILALQLTVAWAGEAAGDPPRLGWWPSDLVDAEGGGDLLARLVPKTAEWAGLHLVRKAASMVDEAARKKLANGDRVSTLYHFGFGVDEQLDDRLDVHRRARRPPAEMLGSCFLVGRPWDPHTFVSMAESLGTPTVDIVPNGRHVSLSTSSPLKAARLLAAALVPLPDEYPLPHAEIPS